MACWRQMHVCRPRICDVESSNSILHAESNRRTCMAARGISAFYTLAKCYVGTTSCGKSGQFVG
ncbi:hypothetical protein DPV78_001996 [Talaromyces pinophilus]|nr:hypothetical protein DPV78_001996 [Talaromyces pinophilus]